MINKELLSNVLGVEIYQINIIGNDVMYKIGTAAKWTEKKINIHELAHKCKEWAYSKSYKIASYKSYNNWICKDPFKGDPYIGADTEPEAIFKACEWILEQDNV